jgi:outer membrane protein TolC
MKKLFASFLFTIMAGASINSQAQVTVSPELKKAIDDALNNSKVLQNEHLLQEQAENNRKAIWNKYLPKVGATAAYAYLQNDLVLDVPATTLPLLGTQIFDGTTTLNNQGNVFIAGLTAKQVLFSGGQIANGAKAMEKKNEGDRLMSDLKEDDIVKDVISSFDHLRLVDAAFDLVKESETRLQKEFARVERAIEQGLAVPYDRDKIKLAHLSLDAQAVELAAKKQLLYLKLSNMTGYDSLQIANIAYSLAPFTVVENLSIDNRNELKALDAYGKALDYNLKKEKGSLLPTVGAFATFGYGSIFNANSKVPLGNTGVSTQIDIDRMSLAPNFIVGGILKWELFGGLERKHKIEAVKIDQAILANKKEDAAKNMNLQLQNYLVNYKMSNNQLTIAQQKEKIALQNLTTADKQYKLGLINVTERLAAESEIYNCSLGEVQALIQQRRAAMDTYSATAPLINAIQVQ